MKYKHELTETVRLKIYAEYIKEPYGTLEGFLARYRARPFPIPEWVAMTHLEFECEEDLSWLLIQI
jgi:hypothetical protein